MSASKPGAQISQPDAGRIVGKAGQTVGRWELGKLEPSLMDLIGLAKLYGVDVAEMTFGSPEDRATLAAAYEPPPTPDVAAMHAAAEDMVKAMHSPAKSEPKGRRRKSG